MIASEFTLLQRTSVVTLSICGIFKEVVTISAAGIVFHDELSLVNISGLLVTIISIACYNYLKVVKMREEAREKVRKRDGDLDDDEAYEGGVYDADDSETRPPAINVPEESTSLMSNQGDKLDGRGHDGNGIGSGSGSGSSTIVDSMTGEVFGSGIPRKKRDD